MDELATRRKWFDEYAERVEQGIIWPPARSMRYVCPCCGYPMLGGRGGYEICRLCNWEDDGQDDPHADEVWGGPNKGLSLSEARANFKKYWVMYPPENDPRICPGDSPTAAQAKQQIVQAFEEMRDETDQKRIDSLWRAIRQNEGILDQEVKKAIWKYHEKHSRGRP